jgi:hypothetical protein
MNVTFLFARERQYTAALFVQICKRWNALHEIGNFCFAMGILRPHLRSYCLLGLLFTGCLLEASEQWHP